jgi:hypothetical protein
MNVGQNFNLTEGTLYKALAEAETEHSLMYCNLLFHQ